MRTATSSDAFDVGRARLRGGRARACLAAIDRSRGIRARQPIDDALAAFETLARLEGILPALESAHALAYVERLALAAGTVRRSCW